MPARALKTKRVERGTDVEVAVDDACCGGCLKVMTVFVALLDVDELSDMVEDDVAMGLGLALLLLCGGVDVDMMMMSFGGYGKTRCQSDEQKRLVIFL
mmetsp:Transcript_15754/g.31971  ORF Transcript_15754/g.31971 Transcript_15754/m.31971 type:complete len:98 (+) Transcript_15754:991-1284(+)